MKPTILLMGMLASTVLAYPQTDHQPEDTSPSSPSIDLKTRQIFGPKTLKSSCKRYASTAEGQMRLNFHLHEKYDEKKCHAAKEPFQAAIDENPHLKIHSWVCSKDDKSKTDLEVVVNDGMVGLTLSFVQQAWPKIKEGIARCDLAGIERRSPVRVSAYV